MKAFSLDPGRLRTRLVLEAPTQVPDGMGGHVETWSEAAVVYAAVEPVRPRVALVAGQSDTSITNRITIRMTDAVTRACRFRRGERFYSIRSIQDPDGSGRYLVCETREEGR